MSITIKDIPRDIHRELMGYIDSDKDKISFSTMNKVLMKDPYMKAYRKRLKDDFVMNEAMEERIILVYNDTYPINDDIEDQSPSFETFRKNWIRDNKAKFMRPPPRTKPPSFRRNSKGETPSTVKKIKKSKSKKSISKILKKIKKSKSKKSTSKTRKKKRK